jgi:hypothetical protein
MEIKEEQVPLTLDEVRKSLDGIGYEVPTGQVLLVSRMINPHTPAGIRKGDQQLKEEVARVFIVEGAIVYKISDKTSQDTGIQIGDRAFINAQMMGSDNWTHRLGIDGLEVRIVEAYQVVGMRRGVEG